MTKTVMTKTLIGLGDRMLGALLKQEKAGACVPGFGTTCSGTYVACGSYCSGGVYFTKYCDSFYNCYGVCTSNGVLAYTKKTGTGC
jgi:hypothetical protein